MMKKTKNLSEQLNEYNTDDEKLCGTNFAIHKNVMIWGGTIIQLSNISSISRYNHWENQEEHYFEETEKIVSFKELRKTDRLFNLVFWGAIISLILAIFQSFFGFLFW